MLKCFIKNNGVTVRTREALHRDPAGREQTNKSSTARALPEDGDPTRAAVTRIETPAVEERLVAVRAEAEREAVGLPLERGHVEDGGLAVAAGDLGVGGDDRGHLHAAEDEVLGEVRDHLAIGDDAEALERGEVHPAHRPLGHRLDEALLAGAGDDRHLPGQLSLAVVGERRLGELRLVGAREGRDDRVVEELARVALELREREREVRAPREVCDLLVAGDAREGRFAAILELGGGHELHVLAVELLEAREAGGVVDLGLGQVVCPFGVDDALHPGDRDHAAIAVDEHRRPVLERDVDHQLVADDAVERLQRARAAARALVDLLRPRLLLSRRHTVPPLSEIDFLGRHRITLRFGRLPGSLPERHCHPFPGSRLPLALISSFNEESVYVTHKITLMSKIHTLLIFGLNWL